MKFGCGKTVTLFVLHSMIILTGLRAYVIPDNVPHNVKGVTVGEYRNDLMSENPLAFLDGFVFEDSSRHLVTMTASAPRKLAKRSVSRSLVPHYMMDMYELLSDRRYKVAFDTARSYHSTSKLKVLF